MKTLVPLSSPLLADDHPEARAAIATLGRKSSAYLTLTKPRIAVMVLITVATGFLLGARGSTYPPSLLGTQKLSTLLLTLLGTGFVAGAASVWNQVLEKVRDGQMRRTASRPLPMGIVTTIESAIFGTILGIAGVAILAVAANVVASLVAASTFFLYVAVYTPLKPLTTLNTAIGAIPGALPPVIGWAAATGGLGIEAWSLFFIVFLWQFPHFLAIAWIHREDYARGGHKMLPSVDPTGVMTARQAVTHALALIPVGLLPTALGMAGTYYFVGALALGLFYLVQAVRFWSDVSDASARRLLRASFLYLPAILALLLLNPMPV
jgi:protoheme IX farnesyltransferase